MAENKELTPLARFIVDWIKNSNTNGSTLYREAGLPPSLYTQLKDGSIHDHSTLRRLAKVMKVSPRQLFELAFFKLGELEPEDIDIRDPELRLFFKDNLWDELLVEEQALIKDAVRLARRMKLLREEHAPASGRRPKR